MSTMVKVRELFDRYAELGLTGDEDAVKVYDWEPRESEERYPTTYFEEWDVSLNGKHLGCLHDDGDGYNFASGYKAGYLDY